MAEMGIFKNYNFAIMVHLNSNQTIIRPKFVVMDAFDVSFTGKPSHAAASPWDGINALDALQLTFHAIDLLRQQCEPSARISYFIKEGGSASNIITDHTICQIEFRHENTKKLNDLKGKIINCVKGAAIATGNIYEIKETGYQYKNLLPNEYGENIIKETLKELEMSYTTDIVPTGSSDIGNVSNECPAFHPLLKTSEDYFSLHTKEMVNVVKSKYIDEIIYHKNK